MEYCNRTFNICVKNLYCIVQGDMIIKNIDINNIQNL